MRTKRVKHFHRKRLSLKQIFLEEVSPTLKPIKRILFQALFNLDPTEISENATNHGAVQTYWVSEKF